MSKNNLKERIFNYENYIGGVDMDDNPSVFSPAES